jgi:hypothetical protein
MQWLAGGSGLAVSTIVGIEVGARNGRGGSCDRSRDQLGGVEAMVERGAMERGEYVVGIMKMRSEDMVTYAVSSMGLQGMRAWSGQRVVAMVEGDTRSVSGCLHERKSTTSSRGSWHHSRPFGWALRQRQ